MKKYLMDLLGINEQARKYVLESYMPYKIKLYHLAKSSSGENSINILKVKT